MCRFFGQSNVVRRGSCFESKKHFANFDLEGSSDVGIDNNPFFSSKIRKLFCMTLGKEVKTRFLDQDLINLWVHVFVLQCNRLRRIWKAVEIANALESLVLVEVVELEIVAVTFTCFCSFSLKA